MSKAAAVSIVNPTKIESRITMKPSNFTNDLPSNNKDSSCVRINSQLPPRKRRYHVSKLDPSNFTNNLPSNNKNSSRVRINSQLPPKKRRYHVSKLDDDQVVTKQRRQKKQLQSKTSLLPIAPTNVNSKIDRERVLKMIRIHKIIYDNLLNEDKVTTMRDRTRPCTRAANIVEDKFFKCLPIVGAIPGVEIGDKFNNRTELSLIGLHLPKQPGIASNSTTNNKCKFRKCVSIVANENDYENDMKDPNYLVYSGHGGVIKKNKGEGKDQKLKGGNLTLMNSKTQKNEVRVIRGRMENGKNVYIYYGLYVVEDWYKTREKSGNLIFKFCLKRIPGQQALPNA